MASYPTKHAGLVSTPAGCALQWQEWDDFYIVYQPSSAETHVFNETTAVILQCLQDGPLATAVLKERTETTLDVGQGDLDDADFALATQRLEELGLVEYLDDVSAVQ